MRRLGLMVLSFLAFAGFSPSLEAKLITCSVEYSGAGKTETKFSTDPLSLVVVTTLYDENGNSEGEPTVKTLLANDNLCGAKVDVQKACQIKEKSLPRFGYAFSVVCSSDSSLEFNVDENGGGHTICRRIGKPDDHYETQNCK